MKIRNGNHEIKELFPMRANSFDYHNATLAEWQDPNVVYELKLDGERALLHVEDGFVALTGRRVSDVTGHLPEKGEYVPHLTDFDIPQLHGTVIDGELIHPSWNFDLLRSIMGSGTAERAIGIQDEKGKLGFVAFDILYYKGQNVMNKPFKERRALLETVIDVYRLYAGKYIDYVIQFPTSQYDIKTLFDDLVINGQNEGFMRKDLNAPYKICDGSKKSSDVLKLKKLITLDGVVMGYEYGKGKYNKEKVAKLVFGQYKDGVLTERASFDGFTADTIAAITADPESYIGKVVEIKCNEVLKSGKLRHPKHLRFREDKAAEDCTWDELNIEN